MGVKKGYKQTEMGVIPEDWTIVPIGSICSIHVGSDLKQANYAYYQDEFYKYPVFSNTVADRGVYGFYINPEYEGESLTIVGRGVGLGTAFKRSGGYGAIGRLLVLFPGRNVDASYMTEYINNRVCFYFESGGIPQLTGLSLAKYQIVLPPTLTEQQSITSALSDADALIESLEKLIAKKRLIKQGAMQELLTGKRRLPGFSGEHEYITDQLGTRPSDWRLYQLKNLVDEDRGIRYGIVQPGKFDPNGRYMIRGQDYSEAKGWANPNDVFRVCDAIEERFRNARVRTGDLIMTIVGYCGHIEMIPSWLDGANLTQTTARIAIRKDRADPAFCKYIIQSSVGQNQVTAFIKGAAQPGLNCGDVEQFYIPLPSVIEQSAIASVLSDMDAEIEALEAKLDKARSIKQGMMQELLTGRIRLV
jgi:type I restriction enzyme S subunit